MLILKEKPSPDPSCSRRGRKVGGNRRPRSWTICRVCLAVFPMPNLKRRYCSMACKVKAQTTGRRTFRRSISKARSAQSLLRYHVQAGHIVRPTTCEACGASDRPIEGAHFNYDEPLRVRWLCRSCHVRWDKREPKGGTVRVDGIAARTETTPATKAGAAPAGEAA